MPDPTASGPVTAEDIQALAETEKELYVDPVIDALRKRAHGDEKLIDLLHRVRLTVPPVLSIENQPNAWATQSGDEAAVEVDLNYIRYMHSSADIVATLMTGSEAAEQVMFDLGQSYGAALSQAIHVGGALPTVHLNVAELEADAAFKQVVANLSPQVVTELVAWTILHEVAHHYLGHLRPDHPIEEGLSAQYDLLARGRKQEAEADAWAFDQMAALSMPAFALSTYLAFEAGFEGIRQMMGISPGLTHPTFAERAAAAEALPYAKRMPPTPWHEFFTVLGTVDLLSGRKGITLYSIAVPSRETVGAGGTLAVVTERDAGASVPDKSYPMFVEYRDGAVQLFSRGPPFRTEMTIDDVGGYRPLLRMVIHDPPTGAPAITETRVVQRAIVDIATKQDTIGGVAVDRLMAITPASMWAEAVAAVTKDEDVRLAAQGVVVDFNRAAHSIMLAYAKGESELTAVQALLEAESGEARSRLTALLGDGAAESVFGSVVPEEFLEVAPGNTFLQDLVAQLRARGAGK